MPGLTNLIKNMKGPNDEEMVFHNLVLDYPNRGLLNNYCIYCPNCGGPFMINKSDITEKGETDEREWKS